MNAGSARLDIGFHDLEAVERATKAGFGIGDNRCKPVARDLAFREFDLVGALQGAIDLARQLGTGIGGVERLVGIHGPGDIGVGSNLPARQIDRLQAGTDLLHRLIARHGAKRIDIGLGLEQAPELFGAAFSERIADLHRAAQLEDVLDAIAALDTVKTVSSGTGNQIFEACHFCHHNCGS